VFMPVNRKIDAKVMLAVGCLWLGALTAGTRWLLNYEAKPASTGSLAARWPTGTRILRSPNSYTLLMFAHPDCPCSQASLSELERVIVDLPARLETVIVFSKPGSDLTEVRRAPLWKRAATMPRVSVFLDRRGEETGRFGASVSGQTLLYDPDGRLDFSGGITAARGHEGDNYGASAVVAFVQGRLKEPVQARVFGCSLRNPDARTLKEEPSWSK
jgi:hypothetical protein